MLDPTYLQPRPDHQNVKTPIILLVSLIPAQSTPLLPRSLSSENRSLLKARMTFAASPSKSQHRGKNGPRNKSRRNRKKASRSLPFGRRHNVEPYAPRSRMSLICRKGRHPSSGVQVQMRMRNARSRNARGPTQCHALERHLTLPHVSTCAVYPSKRGPHLRGRNGREGEAKWRGKGTYHLQVVFCTMNPPTRGPISGPINGLAVYTIIGAESSCYDSVNGKFFSARR